LRLQLKGLLLPDSQGSLAKRLDHEIKFFVVQFGHRVLNALTW